MTMTEIYKDEKSYVLVYREADSGAILLETFYGTVGMASLGIELSSEEVALFNVDNAFASKLAYDICKDPEKYWTRRVSDDRLDKARQGLCP